MSRTRTPEISLSLHPRQSEALASQATEILYGGAAGGGKSHLMRVAAILWAASIPGLQVYLFRRIQDDLIKNHVEGPSGLRVMLAPWVELGWVDIVGEEIRFWNESRIFLCHCKDEKHRFKYLGAEIHVLLIDELTTFSEVIYRFLRGRVRAVGLPELPAEYQGKFPRIVCGSNPGNLGHLWVKRAFVDHGQGMWQTPDSEGGMVREFIPAKLADNPSMEQDDPTYRIRLRGLGSDSLVRAMEDGDWDVIEGAFFDNWSAERHIIEPFTIPEHWMRYRSLDWGSAKPFSVGWWAVADGDPTPTGQWFPRGAIIRYREWYGCQRDEAGHSVPNVGLKMDAQQVADGIKERQPEKVAFGVADPSMFNSDGGPSIAERMLSRGLGWQKADNRRVPHAGAMSGWDMMRARLNGDEEGPRLFVFKTCRDFIRTVPAMVHNPMRAEDMLKEGQEDHVADEARYACMARPWVRDLPQPARSLTAPMTWDDLLQAQPTKRRKKRI